MTFEREFLDLFAIEAAEFRRQAAERPNQCKLRDKEVNMAARPRLLGKRQAKFGFALHVAQRVARDQKTGAQRGVRVVYKREIADLVRDIESAARQVDAGPHVFHPGCDKGGEI
jgi:hypothetical protein